MWIGLVIVLAAAVGGGVYLLSLRSLQGTDVDPHTAPASSATSTARVPEAIASQAPTPAVAPAAPAAQPASAVSAPPAAALPAAAGTVYVPLALDERPSLATRFVRLLGLIALVAVAGLILAVSIWQVAAVIGDLLRHYLGGG